MKKRITSFLMAAMLLGTAGCNKKPEPVVKEETAINVSVYQAGKEKIKDSVSYTGEIKAFESVGVASKLSARVTEVFVQEGDRVTAGQVIAKVDDTDVRLTYDQVLASYNSAVANQQMVVNSSTVQSTSGANQQLESAQIAYDASVTTYEREKLLFEQNSDVKLAEQALTDATSAYQRAKQIYDQDTSLIAARNTLSSAQSAQERTQKLFDMGAATQIELDQAIQATENAQANVDSLELSKQGAIDQANTQMIQAEENLKKIQATASIAVTQAENAMNNAELALNAAKEKIDLVKVSNQESIKTAAASVSAAQANLAIAENNLKHASITAPISGYVATKAVTVGQMVSPGIDLFQIKNSNDIHCEINVTESVIASIHEGTSAIISVQSAGVENINGKVTLVNMVKNDATGMYKVQITMPNPNNRFKVGMFVDVELITEQSSGAIVIPTEAIFQEKEESYVYIANGEVAERVVVVTGIANDEMTEIVSGIAIGDAVIVDGKEYLSDKNNKIKIISSDAESQQQE